MIEIAFTNEVTRKELKGISRKSKLSDLKFKISCFKNSNLYEACKLEDNIKSFESLQETNTTAV